MKKFLFTLALASIAANAAWGATVSYDTVGSSLLCGAAANCLQNNTMSVTVGTGPNTITLNYVTGSGTNITTPSFINLGFLDAIANGSPTLSDLTGLILTIHVNSTPPGAGGSLPNGSISGSIAIRQSTASIVFSPNNTTTQFGTLPGVVISGASASFTYQIRQTVLDLVPPTSGGTSGLGETSIQGAVVDTTTPEPSTFIMLGAGFSLLGLLRRRAVR